MGLETGPDDGMWAAFEARRKGRGTGGERAADKEQGKKVHFKEEEQRKETREQNTDEQDVISGFEE